MRRAAAAVLGLGLLLVAGSGAMIGTQLLRDRAAPAEAGGRGGFAPALATLAAAAQRLAGETPDDAAAPSLAAALAAAPEPPASPAADLAPAMPPGEDRPLVRRGAEGAAEGFACTLEGAFRRCRAGG